MAPFYEHAVTVFMAFFAIMNPLANTAVFAGLTAGKDHIQRRNTAFKALIISFAIILVFALLGKSIFHLFGITLPALRVAGGILVFMVGYHMLQGSSSSMHSAEGNSDADIAVSPLAVPILAGPGTIATAMNFSAAGGWVEIITTVIMFALLCLITFVCFIFSGKIMALIGDSGLNIVTRLMGLILTVIGVQMLITGVHSIITPG